MMKKSKKVLAVVIMGVMAFALTACGSVDAPGMVKGQLDLMQQGKVTEDIANQFDMEKSEIEDLYKSEFDTLVEELTSSIHNDDYINNGGKKTVEAFMKKWLAKCKYEVSDEATKDDDGNYVVTVKVYPIDINSVFDYMNSDLKKDWTKKIQSGEYKYTTEKQLTIDMYSDLMDKLNERMDKVGYGDAVDMTVKVEADKDNVYVAKPDDIANVLTRCLGERN